MRVIEASPEAWIYDSEDSELLNCDRRWRVRRRIAELLRTLKTHTLASDLDEAALCALEDKLSCVVGTLGASSRMGSSTEYMARYSLNGPPNRLSLELSGVIGRSNAASLPIRFFRNSGGGRMYAEVHPDSSHEGPPGLLHGGLIAALFDEFLSCAQHELSGPPGLTKILSVKYLRPTPVNQVSTLILCSTEVEGRTRIIRGELWSRDQPTAVCDAHFVQPRGSEL